MNFDIKTEEGLKNSVAWFLNTMSHIKHRGMWAVPRSASVYRIDQNTKTLTKLSGIGEEDSIKIVAEAAGWKYEEVR